MLGDRGGARRRGAGRGARPTPRGCQPSVRPTGLTFWDGHVVALRLRSFGGVAQLAKRAHAIGSFPGRGTRGPTKRSRSHRSCAASLSRTDSRKSLAVRSMSRLGSPGVVAASLLGAVLLLAAYAKAIDPQGFAVRLRDMVPLPGAIAYPGALLAAAFEAGLGGALLGGSRHTLVLFLTSAAFLAFAGIMGWQLVRPGGAAACGCFGQLLERTPRQAFYEDIGFVALSGLAWLGRTARSEVLHPGPSVLGVGAGVALALCAPWLPLDDQATALAPGASVEATQLDGIVPELRAGRHLVLLLDRAHPATTRP